jgi:uncharacterized protein YjbI with pentapeptide repeats
MSNESTASPQVPTNPPMDDLATTEAQARIAKLALEQQKLTLEHKSLARQLSLQGLLLEWLRAATVPAALLAAALTFYVGYGQLRQSEENRVADRFDKALARLASEKTNERMTGVSGLRLFLKDQNEFRQTAAIHFLINAVAGETDAIVQSAIIDVFSELKGSGAHQGALNQGLSTVVERNRSLTQLLVREWPKRREKERKRRIAEITSLKLKAERIPSPIPEDLLSKLSLKQYLRLLEEEHGPFDNLPASEAVPLKGLADVINALIDAGARHYDFSRVYCHGCKFAPARQLEGGQFDGAFLRRADFSRMKLARTSFRGADIGGAVFFGADLTGANLSNPNEFTVAYSDTSYAFPIFECAKLYGADLAGMVLAVMRREFKTTWQHEHAIGVVGSSFRMAQVDNTTKMPSFSILVFTSVSDAYLDKYPNDRFGALFRDSLPENAVLKDNRSSARFSRSLGHFAKDAAVYETTYSQSADIEISELPRMRKWARPLLKWHLDQSNWKAITLLSEIAALLEKEPPVKLDIPENSGLRNSISCSESALSNLWDLTVDSGLFATKKIED